MGIETFLNTDKQIAIAVIGDICLDLAYQVTTEGAEVSVETGLQTFSVTKSKVKLGGACNVAVNCKTLGANRVDLYGINGDDFFGDLLLTRLHHQHIGTDGVIRQTEAWATHVYHKVYEMGIEHPRFDSGNFNEPSEASIGSLLTVLQEKLSSYDAILINEQVPKGLHSAAFQQALKRIIDGSGTSVLWFADCRKLNDVYTNTIHKLNEQESLALYRRYHGGPRPDISALAEWLYRHFAKPVVLTLSNNGAMVHDGTDITTINGLHFNGRIDPVGAGDAFLAGLAVACCRQASLAEAALVGNFCAGVSLQILFETGHPTKEAVLELAAKAEWRYNSQIAQDIRRATYWNDSPIEIITPIAKSTGFPKVAIFDHDGTISTLRQGWKAIMEETMLQAITGTHYAQIDLEELDSLKKEVHAFIVRTTGIQTIEQMYYLADMVRDHGYVDTTDVLSPGQYKQLYNTKLMEMVTLRIQEVKARRLTPEDVTMKGAIAFLQRLFERGTTLYLASGTDTEDVRAEAALLGYDHLFTGGIFGSIGDVHNDPKRTVIKSIISKLEAAPSECVVLGDGPVEMREARRHGLLAIGLLSDEVRRYGPNLAKREPLILGGADLLIPDFSYADHLCNLLGWEIH